MLTDTKIKEEDKEIELKVVIDSDIDIDSGVDGDVKKKKSIVTPKCNECEYTAKNAKELKKHVNVAHIGMFMCDQCDYSSSHKSNLNNHLKAKHEMPVFKCLSYVTTSRSKQFIQSI